MARKRTMRQPQESATNFKVKFRFVPTRTSREHGAATSPPHNDKRTQDIETLKTAMLDTLLHRIFDHSAPRKERTHSDARGQVSQETAFTREADVDGWVFLAEERHSATDKSRTYADVVAGRT